MRKSKKFTKVAATLTLCLVLFCAVSIVSFSAMADDTPVDPPVEAPAAETIYYNHGEAAYAAQSLYVRTRNELQKEDGEGNPVLDYDTCTVTLGTGSVLNCEPVDALFDSALGSSKYTNGDRGVCFKDWQIQVYDAYRAAVICVTPKHNAKITIDGGSMNGYDWIKGAGKFVETYVGTEDGVDAVTCKPVDADCDLTDADYFDSYAHVPEGKSFYLVCRGGDMMLSFLTSITVSPADYDETAMNPTPDAVASESFGFFELTRHAYVSDRKPIVMQNMDVYAYVGDLDKNIEQPFAYAIKSGDNVDLNSSGKFDPDSGNVYKLAGNQVRSSATQNVIVRITAKQDMAFTYNFDLSTVWFWGSIVKVFVEGDGIRLGSHTYTMEMTTPDEGGQYPTATTHVENTVHMQAGDRLYIEFSGNGTIDLNWAGGQLSNESATFDATKRLPFDKANQILQLADIANYKVADWQTIQSIMMEHIALLGTAEDEAAVNQILADAQAAIGEIAQGKDYADLQRDIRDNADNQYATVSYEYAEMGLHASNNIRGGVLLPLTGTKNNEIYYTISDKPVEDLNIDGDCSVSFAPHQVLSHDNCLAVVSLKAVRDMKVTVSVPQLGNNWSWVTTEGNTYVEYYLNKGDRIVKVKREQVKAEQTDYNYVAHLQAGESLYYAVVSAWGTVNLIPSFTFGDDYNPDWTFDALTEATESVEWPSAVSRQVLSDGKAVKGDLFNYEFVYGETLDALDSFEVYQGSAEWENTLFLGNRSEPACMVVRWQWRVTNPYLTVLKFTANEDVFMQMTHGELTLEYVPEVYVKTYVENAEGVRILRHTYRPKVNNAADSFFVSEHLQAGDTMYVVLEPIDRAGGSYPHTLAMTGESAHPKFSADRALYDSAQRADYEAEKALIAHRAAKCAELAAYIETLDENVYSVVNWLTIREQVENLPVTVAELNTPEEVDAAFNAAKAIIDSVPTTAEEAAELQAYKDQKKAELTDYAKESDYSPENWKTVAGYIESAKASIDAAKSKTGVDTAVSAARNRIDKIEKSSAASAKKGCGCGSSAAGGGTLLALLALAAGLTLLARRKTERI